MSLYIFTPRNIQKLGKLIWEHRRKYTLLSLSTSLLLPGLLFSSAEAANSSLTMSAPSRHGLFPSYSPSVRDYALYDCQSQPLKLSFNRSVLVNGRSSNSRIITLKADTAIVLRITEKGVTSEHTLRCLGDDFPRISVKKYVQSLDGNLLMVLTSDNQPSTLVISDTNGVPLWYRYVNGDYSPQLVNRLADGQLEILMSSNKKQSSGPRLDASVDNYILRVDLSGKVSRRVYPYENGKRIAFDNHSYYPTRNGYYFISSRITTSETPPKLLTVENPSNNSEQQALVKLCRAAERWKSIGTRIVRTNEKGLVNWSFEIPVIFPDLPLNPAWLGDENGVRTCYFDEHHPNWVSLDPTNGNLYISLRRTRVLLAVDTNSKKMLWNIGTTHPNGLRIIGDPLGYPDSGMHSGSMNQRGELLVFDNRSEPNDTGRAVIYKVDGEAKTAKFLRAFLPPRDRCTTTGGKVFCPTRVMGNATFTTEGHIIVDWGDKDGNSNLFSIFDRNSALLLDARVPSKRFLTYKSEYVSPYLPNGNRWITLDTIVKATTQNNARTLIN